MTPHTLAGACLCFALAASPACVAAQSTSPDTSGAPAATQRAYTGIRIEGRATMRIGGPVVAEHPTVTAVAPGSPGAKAGIAPGDVILEVDGRDARQEGVRINRIGAYTLRIRRGEEEREVSIVGIPAPARP